MWQRTPTPPNAMRFQRSSTSSPPNSPNSSLGLGSIANKIFGIHAAAMSLQVLRRTGGCVLIHTEGLDACNRQKSGSHVLLSLNSAMGHPIEKTHLHVVYV